MASYSTYPDTKYSSEYNGIPTEHQYTHTATPVGLTSNQSASYYMNSQGTNGSYQNTSTFSNPTSAGYHVVASNNSTYTKSKPFKRPPPPPIPQYSSTNYYSGTPGFQNNSYTSSTIYQNSEATPNEEYTGYGYYGASERAEYSDGSTQSYYPNVEYHNSYDYNTPSNQTEVPTPKQVYSSTYTANKTKSVPPTSVIRNNTKKFIKPIKREQSNSNNNTTKNYSTFDQFRQYYANRQSKPKSSPGETSAPAPALFMGKDTSYPSELNDLMNPFFCALCNSRLNSIKSANIHYESKAHDRHITAWLKKNYSDKGQTAPQLKRFVTESSADPVGVYRCELCSLDLSSAQHALQHYNGKRHRTAASKISPPIGIGYFNMEGKWVQTGKVIDKVTGKETSYILVKTPTGFEPVILQVAPNQPVSSPAGSDMESKNIEGPPPKKPHMEKDAVNSTTDADNVKDENLKEKQEEHYRSMRVELKHAKQSPVNKVPQNPTSAKQLEFSNSSVGKIPQNPTSVKQFDFLKSLSGKVPQNPKSTKEKSVIPDSTSNNQYQSLSLQSHEFPQKLQTPEEALDTRECKVCSISTTSKDQMLLHLKGARHTKKLKALGERPISMLFSSPSGSILESLDTSDPSDISMYRTPSGSYYCKLCNAAIVEVSKIKRHILSKKHLAAQKRQISIDSLASEENKQ